MGYQLNERKVKAEIGEDEVDFNIQRLGWWAEYNQKSEISVKDWEEAKVTTVPKFTGKLFVGIKYAKASGNVALSIACKNTSGKIYVECIDCRNIREGNGWLLRWLKNADISISVIDGTNGQATLKDDLKELKIKKYEFPTVSEVIEANAKFEQGLYDGTLIHGGQPSVVQVVTNTEKRAIGSNGGFGYKCIKEGCEIAILDSMILAYWAAAKAKRVRRKQRVSY